MSDNPQSPTPPAGTYPQQHQPAYQYQPPAYRPAPPALAPNGQPLAGFGDRLLAYLIDAMIFALISLIYTVPFMIWWLNDVFNRIGQLQRAADAGLEPTPGDILALYLPMIIYFVVSIVLSAVLTYLYWVEYQYRKGGQTIGKRAMKIRVILAEPAEAQVTRRGYAMRWLVQFVAGNVVPMFSLIDGLWQLWDKPLQQCLHDKAAKTVVVKVG